MEFVVLLSALFATCLGAICGNGGGVIIKPVMDALLTLPAGTISFISGFTVFVMSTTSLIRSRKSDVKVDKQRGLLLAVGGALGGVAGSSLLSMIIASVPDGSMTSLVQNIALILFTIAVFIYTLVKNRFHHLDIRNKVVTFIIGLALGVISAFLGIGGGPINIAVLSYCFSMNSKTAALNSLFIVFFAQLTNLLSTVITKGIPELDYLFLILMAVTAVIGATIGRKISSRISHRTVDKLFLLLMLIIISICTVNIVKFSA